MSLLRNSIIFLKKHASTILTCAGGIGVIVTSVMAVKATPKALSLLENVKEEKGEDLTKIEKIKIAGPAYIPAALMGLSTIACIFGANALNRRQQAALISAYALLDNSYKDYKKKLAELYGKDKVEEIKEQIVKDKHNENPYPVEDGKQLFYDDFSQRYFESTTENILRAEYELNRLMTTECEVCLNKFYELLGIGRVDYGDYLGWSGCELEELYGHFWVDFHHQKVIMDDNMECTIIYMDMEPTFVFKNY